VSQTDASQTDVVVIGGGPAGAAAATLAARAGFRVALFERDEFPRHHVGESLIPAANLTLDRLGLLEPLAATRFPRKHGVQFFSERGASRPFYFEECSDPRLKTTWQVLRSDFDRILLEHAEAAGACTNTRHEVVDVLVENDAVTGVQVVDDEGAVLDIEARAVVDASGTNGLLARRFGERETIPGLENTAVYAHFEDVRLDEGIDRGSTLIFKVETGAWLWLIPLPDAVSIGLVTSARRITSFGRRPEDILGNAIARSPELSERMQGARRTGPVRAVRDFSYHARRDGGRGWMLIGDSLGFIDPMYSTGLFLSLFSTELAVEALVERLGANGSETRPTERPDFAGFSRRWQQAYDRFLPLVRAFYRDDPRFREFAKVPDRRRGLVDLLTGLVDTPEAIAVADELREPNDRSTVAV
jgi:flavin-dependent dehydrogenase